MQNDFITYNIPAHWASPIINGDYSGIEYKSEIRAIEYFIEDNPGTFTVDNDQQFFMVYHDAKSYGIAACDCIEMILLPA